MHTKEDTSPSLYPLLQLMHLMEAMHTKEDRRPSLYYSPQFMQLMANHAHERGH
jgi:hypothetical protein